jgi:acetyl esterase/lipase
LILLAALAGVVPAAEARAPEPRVLVKQPYYLSLHEAEGTPRGTILLLHGGGWRGDLGAAADELMSATIEALVEWGYDVANLGYRSGGRSLDDAAHAFDLLRRRLGPDEPLCMYGTSAGAQLALITAARRGSAVDCVVSLLGPPDLEDFGSKPNSSRGEAQARAAFGAANLAEVSPLRNAGRIAAPVLVGATRCDVFIELADQREFVRRLKAAGTDADLGVIAPGDDVDLEHCVVDGESFDRFQHETRDFLNAVAPAPGTAGPAPDDDRSSFPLGLVVGGAAVLVGLILLARSLRR